MSGELFLVDTWAGVSVLPPSGPPSSRQPTGYSLQTTNHFPIATYGTHLLTPHLGLYHTFRLIFIIADAILSADFLHHIGLSVYFRQSRLTYTLTHLQVLSISTSTASDGPTLPCLDLQDPYAAALAEFPNLFRPRATEQPCQHDVIYHICTMGPPVSAHPCRLPPDRFRVAKQEFDHMLDLGVIHPSSSFWSSPSHGY